MKTLVITIGIFLFSITVHAQFLGGIFNQKATQTQYLIQQIAALQVYIGYIEKGYQIAQDGLHTINDLKKGDLNLHIDHFNSLKTVNSKVKSTGKVEAIQNMQKDILKLYKQTKRQVKNKDMLTSAEQDYINGVFNRLLEDCDQTLDDLINVTTDNKLQLTDDERLKQIDKLYANMQSNLVFARSFANDATNLVLVRIREQNDAATSRKLNGIKN